MNLTTLLITAKSALRRTLNRALPRINIVIVFGLLAACGGGSSGDSPSEATNSSSSSSSSTSSSGSSSSSSSSSSSTSSSSSSSSSSSGGLQRVTVSGQITYDFVPHSTGTGGLRYDLIERRPVRGARIVALNQNDVEVGSATLSDNGSYSFELSSNFLVRLRVEAVLKTSGSLAQWDVEIIDNTNSDALYVLEGALSNTGDSNSVRNLHAPSGWGGSGYTTPRAAAPFAILDVIYTTVRFLEASDSDINLPSLQINWSTENRPVQGDRSEGEITTSFFSPFDREIYLLGSENNDTEEYDSSVIIHEFGHFLESVIFTSNSIGGSHDFDQFLDMRVAFSEGFGNAFASMVNDDPFYQDSFGNNQAIVSQFSVEDEVFSFFGFSEGWYSEVAVQMALYDIFDTDSDAGDSLSLGFDPIYNSLASTQYTQGSAFTSIFKFADAFNQNNPVHQAALTTLMQERGINSLDSFGVGETDSGAFSSALPIYKTLTEGGSIRLCTDNQLGEFNNIDNTQFVRLNILSTGFKSIRVDSGPRGGERDVARVDIFREGERFRFFEFDLGTTPEVNRALFFDTGDYAIAYSEVFNQDGDNQTGGFQCADLSVVDN